ncbi:MAG: hypothetical protein C4530_01720 [Desulfobacteraceae bacterium]|nr:MAG: hypothetical protein C4530_01720 [Desulfobacteraceae bacterium]
MVANSDRTGQVDLSVTGQRFRRIFKSRIRAIRLAKIHRLVLASSASDHTDFQAIRIFKAVEAAEASGFSSLRRFNESVRGT